MYGIPENLDLDRIVGEEATQLRVGQYDFQFTLGCVEFRVQSKIKLLRDKKEIGFWSEGVWPSESFYKIMNVKVVSVAVEGDKEIAIQLENGVEILLSDDSDQYETMYICIEGQDPWII